MKNKRSKTSHKIPDVTRSVVKDLFDILDTSIENPFNNPETYLGHKIKSLDSESLSADAVKQDYLAHEIMSKFNNFDLPVTTRDVAIEGFWRNEHKCSETNRRIRSYEDSPNKDSFLETVIHTAQVKIRRVLPSLTWDLLRNSHDMTSGASPCISYRYSTAGRKLELPEVTLRASKLWTMISHEFDIHERPRILNNSKVTTVPKNSKTDRVICMEPSGNMLLQKAVGNFISKQMCRMPMVDLHDQSVNGLRAVRASRESDEATVDFSAASDTISIETVRLLLPPDWFNYLDMIRSHVAGFYNDEHELTHTCHMEKFSAMGNGFTFELETLIFWAIAQSVEDLIGTRTFVSQYGDDLICSCEAYEKMLPVFEFFGFSINEKKSFSSGNFRESCGMHAYRGVDVSPFYIRRPIDNCTELVLFLNNLRLWCDRVDLILDPRFEKMYHKYKALLPAKIAGTRVPSHMSTLGLIGSLSEHEFRANSSKIEIWHYEQKLSQVQDKGVVEFNPTNARSLRLHTTSRNNPLGLDALPILSNEKSLPPLVTDRDRNSGVPTHVLRKRWVWLSTQGL